MQEYPPWLEQSLALDLARTLAVSNLPSGDRKFMQKMIDEIKTAFCSEFGEGSVEECSAPQNFSGVVYVRLGDSTISNKTGFQCAFEAVEALDQQELSGLATRPQEEEHETKRAKHDARNHLPTQNPRFMKSGGHGQDKVFLRVLPAVIHGLLWVGELHDRITEQDLREALDMLSPSAESSEAASGVSICTFVLAKQVNCLSAWHANTHTCLAATTTKDHSPTCVRIMLQQDEACQKTRGWAVVGYQVLSLLA